MADPVRKAAMIRCIENLQLPISLIQALDDAQQAAIVMETLHCLEKLNQQWN